jgi:hypothetical protein
MNCRLQASQPQEASAGAAPIRSIATDVLHYWELRRLICNGALAAVAVVCYVRDLPYSRNALTFSALSSLFVLAVAANFLYCSAYIPDVFVQLPGHRERWRRWRWALFTVGVFLAVFIALPVAHALAGGFLAQD